MNRQQFEKAAHALRENPPEGVTKLARPILDPENGKVTHFQYCALGVLGNAAGVPDEVLANPCHYATPAEDSYGPLREPLLREFGIDPSNFAQIWRTNDKYEQASPEVRAEAVIDVLAGFVRAEV